MDLYKLDKLPRHQRLRKLAKLLEEADAAAAAGRPGSLTMREMAAAASSLEADAEFSDAARRAFGAAAAELRAGSEGGAADIAPRRPVNVLRHALASAIGKQLADWDFVDGEGELSAGGRIALPGVRVFLEDLRSPFNVGSAFRTAESFGVERLYLSPLCAPATHPRAQRSAMGCVSLVPWEIAELDSIDLPVFALETGGKPLEDFPFPARGVMVVGSEELGVSPAALARADASAGRVSVRTYGAKGSLNVGVAFGIAMRAWAEAVLNARAGSPA